MAEDKYAQLANAIPISQSLNPKIQRVPRHLRDREQFANYYSPRFVSFGPIHHGQSHLQQGEQYKLMWARMYLQDTERNARDSHQLITENITRLKELYTEDAIGQFNDEQLAWMLFVDGCALLQILKYPDILEPEKLNVKVDQMVLVRLDVFLLENQLPFRVLRLLSPDDDDTLLKTIDKFLLCHHFSKDKPQETNSYHQDQQEPAQSQGERECKIQVHGSPPPPPPPPHLLDRLRWNVLHHFHPQRSETSETKDNRPTYRNIQELKSAGIKVRRSESECPINISFSSGLFSGELRIPDIVVDETIAPTYLNLMAYEVYPDFDNNYAISSYVEFLDSLIDHPEDVKELRANRILHNGLGSDEEVAKLFNVISTDLVPDTRIYASVRAAIEKHYKNQYKTWIFLAKHTYFSNPWAFIAFLAAFLALLLTFIQTWFAVFPKSK